MTTKGQRYSLDRVEDAVKVADIDNSIPDTGGRFADGPLCFVLPAGLAGSEVDGVKHPVRGTHVHHTICNSRRRLYRFSGLVRPT